jgi:type I restriction enzyme, S subunit
MNASQFIDHFDCISEAPDAIPRLRSFILDLAVRGKLVEQDSRDEPASELLRRIQSEKSRLVHAGEIKSEKPLAAIEEDEILFEIPANWLWVRLKDVTSYIQRGKSPEYATDEGLPVISQKCVQWSGLELEFAKFITRESIEEYEPIRFLQNGDLLWNSTGTGTIGRIIKVKEPPPKLVCDSHVTVVRCLQVDAEYIRSWLRSDHVYAVIEDRAAGSTNQVELTSQLAMNQVVPVPPLAEQHRIVGKVDELMALCDRLEAAQVDRESRRDGLAAASLHHLNNGGNADEFREHTRFYFNHLPRLTTRPEHVQQLRQTILKLAVRGKLVPQDSDDEPASELLKRIQGQKVKLIKEKTLKRQKSLLPIEAENIPFEVPHGWAWAKADHVFLNITDGFHNTPSPVAEGRPYITAKHIRPLKIDFDNCLYVDERNHRQLFAKTRVKRGDILIVNIGAGCGTPAMVEVDFEFSFKNVAIVNLPSDLDNNYILQFLMYYRVLAFEELIKGGAQPFLGLAMLREMLIPIPPLGEQNRIVAKVDELMALCDQLEAQLTTTQTESHRLLEAVLHEALAPATNAG